MAMCQNDVFHFIWTLQSKWWNGRQSKRKSASAGDGERNGAAVESACGWPLTKHPLKLDNIQLH